MNKLTLMATLVKERFSERTLPREPEPDLVMDDPEQVAAYHEAGSIDGLMASSYLFHSARVTQTIQGCKLVLDLGCGPAVQLCQIAQLNPDTQFIGVDLSPTMLDQARHNVTALGLTNIRFVQGDITKLTFQADASVDGVISTVALHHLPTKALLLSAFREIKRVLMPGGALYLTDFGRLKRLDSVIYFAYQNAGRQPHLFTLDYERSLRAAFELEEFKSATADILAGVGVVHHTFMVPMLVLVKSADRPMGEPARKQILALQAKLTPRARGDLNDIRIFFRLGGLNNDPFQ